MFVSQLDCLFLLVWRADQWLFCSIYWCHFPHKRGTQVEPREVENEEDLRGGKEQTTREADCRGEQTLEAGSIMGAVCRCRQADTLLRQATQSSDYTAEQMSLQSEKPRSSLSSSQKVHSGTPPLSLLEECAPEGHRAHIRNPTVPAFTGLCIWRQAVCGESTLQLRCQANLGATHYLHLQLPFPAF